MITTSDLHASKSAEDEWWSCRCLFLLSTGRVATTTIVKLLNLCSEIAAYHEPRPLLGEESKDAYVDLNEKAEQYRMMFETARRFALLEAHRCGKLYAEHTLMVSFAPLILQDLPSDRFIHLHRHPGEIVLSGMRRGWYQGHPWDKFRLSPPRDLPPPSGSQRGWTPFAKICWYWKSVNDFILRFNDIVGARRVLSLKFYTYTDASCAEWRRMFEYVHVTLPSHELVRETLTLRHNQQASGTFPPYEHWSEAEHQILQEIAGETILRLGYA